MKDYLTLRMEMKLEVMAVAVAVSRGGKGEEAYLGAHPLHLISNSIPTRKEERRIQSMVN